MVTYSASRKRISDHLYKCPSKRQSHKILLSAAAARAAAAIDVVHDAEDDAASPRRHRETVLNYQILNCCQACGKEDGPNDLENVDPGPGEPRFALRPKTLKLLTPCNRTLKRKKDFNIQFPHWLPGLVFWANTSTPGFFMVSYLSHHFDPG